MNMSATVVVLQNSEDESDRCKEELAENFNVVLSTTDYEAALASVEKEKPDFLITSLFVSGVDGVYVIKRAKELSEKTRCIVTDSVISTELISFILSSGASLFIEKPIDFAVLKESLSGFCRPESQEISNRVIYADSTDKKPERDGNDNVDKENSDFEKEREKELDLVIGRLFINLGISPKIKGFNYLRTAIVMLIKEPRLIEAVTKELYPKIGEKYATTASKVERAIRHAIKVAWDRGNTAAFNKMLGVEAYSSNERPTNSEFMALIADRLMLQNYILY